MPTVNWQLPPSAASLALGPVTGTREGKFPLKQERREEMAGARGRVRKSGFSAELLHSFPMVSQREWLHVSVSMSKTRINNPVYREGAWWGSIRCFSKGYWEGSLNSPLLLSSRQAAVQAALSPGFQEFQREDTVCDDTGQTCWNSWVGPVWETNDFSSTDKQCRQCGKALRK